MSVKLSQLIESLDVRIERGTLDLLITDMVDDSRRVTPGCAFVARSGSARDGRCYIDEAIARGATAVIAAGSDPAVVGQLGERFFDHPADKLRLVGVTGTNGKSTICFLIQHLLENAGVHCGLISTVVVDDGQTRSLATLTTPGAIDVSRYLAQMVTRGCDAAVCEVSSHALHQGRTAALDFDVAVFTNLTGDHLDYHQTMEAYADAKAMLFESLSDKAWAIVHRDDAYAQRMARDCKAQLLWTTLDDEASEPETNVCRAKVRQLTSDRSDATFTGPWGSVDAILPLVGRHNVANVLQAITAANCITPVSQGLRDALSNCPQVPGRLERVRTAAKTGSDPVLSHVLSPNVLVDYAHTHDSLENVLLALRLITHQRGGRLICLFGCGGDRDTTKRAKMGEVACRLADVVVITSDNPRSEDPDAIIRDILVGIADDKRKTITVLSDRAEAIQLAVQAAEAHDTILLAGKGHEDYQIIAASDPQNSLEKTRKIHFDDREHAAAALEQWIEQHTPGAS